MRSESHKRALLSLVYYYNFCIFLLQGSTFAWCRRQFQSFSEGGVDVGRTYSLWPLLY